MVTSVASVTGGIASLLLSTLVLCFNVPRFIAPNGWSPIFPAGQPHTRASGKNGFHATATIENAGNGNKRLTVRLEFGPSVHDEDEGL